MADCSGDDGAGGKEQQSPRRRWRSVIVGWLADHVVAPIASWGPAPIVSWGACGVIFAVALLVGDSSHAILIIGLALVFLASDLAAFLFILVNAPQFLYGSGSNLNLRRLGAAFAVTFVAVVAAYAAADYAASHSEVIRNGKPVMARDGPVLHPCYVQPSPSGKLQAATLSPGEAIYVAVGTLTTIGSGDIAARSTCRLTTVGELAIGFPMVSLAIAGLAAGLFKKLT